MALSGRARVPMGYQFAGRDGGERAAGEEAGRAMRKIVPAWRGVPGARYLCGVAKVYNQKSMRKLLVEHGWKAKRCRSECARCSRRSCGLSIPIGAEVSKYRNAHATGIPDPKATRDPRCR